MVQLSELPPMKPSVLLAVPLLASSLAAQFTSPVAFDAIEGNASQTVLFGATDRRFQQIDASMITQGAQTISQIAFRRDGDRAAASAVSRTFDLTIVMGHGSLATASNTFDDNYSATPTTVFATQQVTLPDWTGLVAGPAAFDFVVTLDTPFNYNGTEALVWEIVAENSSQPGTVYLDRQNTTSPFGYDQAIQTATGCTESTQTNPFELNAAVFNYGPSHPSFGQRIFYSGEYGAADQPVALDIGLNVAPIQVPGLCGWFHHSLIFSVGIGNAAPSGAIPEFIIDLPYDPMLEGVELANQFLSLDIGQPGMPFILSDVKKYIVPTPGSTLDCCYLYAAGGTSTTGSKFTQRGVIVEFQ